MSNEKLAAIKLETERLIIRRFEIDDKKDIFEIVSDRETCYADGGYEPFEEMDDEFCQLMNIFSKDEGRYVIILKSINKVIGLVHLTEIKSRAVSCYEIGYVVNKNFRRRGYGTEAISAVISFCFNEAHIEMITAGVFEGNIKSNSMLEKIGFIKEGITYKAMNHCQDGIINMINYYIDSKRFKSEFAVNNADDCVFCKIVNGTLPSRKIYEDS